MAYWLDATFYGFDKAILSFWNTIAQGTGGFLTPIMEIISLFGEKGIFMILLSLTLMLFKGTRRHGVTALIAIAIGAILTNVLLKNLIARARPYTHDEFKAWWSFVGGSVESDYSFPSGHSTIATDCLLAIFLVSKNKKISWLCLIPALLICASRNYLMVHYPTDVIAGILVGSLSAVLSKLLIDFIYKKIQRNVSNKFCSFVLNASIVNLFTKNSDVKASTKTEVSQKTEDSFSCIDKEKDLDNSNLEDE